ncbi:PREDICTED: uncharacterized protein LOC102874917 [Elephantulus edwardii]|uniref:uncharacterized protein LOC102874917 n=1 Tax=Elephantulus edwardii TaxID=28737 RepID=UPI0003F0DEB9|nr:PREDICTED: uncharacterized protein LOC102874917 [Elephantulus edwardii]
MTRGHSGSRGRSTGSARALAARREWLKSTIIVMLFISSSVLLIIVLCRKMAEISDVVLSSLIALFSIVLLTVKEPVDFKVIGPAYPILAKIGEDAVLTCQLLPKRNAINMEVRWYRSELSTPVFVYRDGAVVTEMQMEEYRSRVEWIENNIDEGNVALKIHNIQPSDHGQYWCHFQDRSYSAETSLQLRVAGLGSDPDIHMQRIVEGRIQLVCTSEGWFPEPQVYWKNARGENMETFLEHHFQNNDDLFYVESTLEVRDASLETMSCVIHNPILNEEKKSTISIPEKLQTELASLQVIGPSQPIIVRVGEDTQLTCYLFPKTNAQNMEVRWVRVHRHPAVYVYMDGNHVIGEQMEEYRGRTVLLSDDIDEGKVILNIHSAKVSDDGQYRCLFEKDGVYQEASLDLKVAGMGSSPLITRKELEHREMELICSSDGWFPQPHVQWRNMEGKVIPLLNEVLSQDSDGLFHVQSSVLVRNKTIVNVTCSITNLLLGQEKTAAFSPSEFRMSYLWTILPVLAILLVLGAVRLKRKENYQKEAFPQNTTTSSTTTNNQNNDHSWDGSSFFLAKVILDPNTAHPELILSEGNKCVTHGHAWQELPDLPQRFNFLPCVLGQEGFTSGRWYWDVNVENSTDWCLGVARSDVTRKCSISMLPENGFWAMGCYGNQYWAITSPPIHLYLALAPKRVRISLDYDSGQLSFYNINSKRHIYTFPKCSFSGKLHSFFLLWSPDVDSPDIFPALRPFSVSSTRKTAILDFGNQSGIPRPSSLQFSPLARRWLTRSSEKQGATSSEPWQKPPEEPLWDPQTRSKPVSGKLSFLKNHHPIRSKQKPPEEPLWDPPTRSKPNPVEGSINHQTENPSDQQQSRLFARLYLEIQGHGKLFLTTEFPLGRPGGQSCKPLKIKEIFAPDVVSLSGDETEN